MKNLFFVDHIAKTIAATKNTLKKASVLDSNEYTELMKRVNRHPDYKIIVKVTKKPTNKNNHEGLNGPFIEKYIAIKDNAETLKKEYNAAKELGGFPVARKWFLKTFEGFNMDDAIAEIIAKAGQDEAPAVSDDQKREPHQLATTEPQKAAA